jgi:hypothetical protein
MTRGRGRNVDGEPGTLHSSILLTMNFIPHTFVEGFNSMPTT